MQLNTLYTATPLWTSDRPVVETSSKQHVQDTKHIRPWRDSNPQSQRPQTHSKGKVHTLLLLLLLLLLLMLLKEYAFIRMGARHTS